MSVSFLPLLFVFVLLFGNIAFAGNVHIRDNACYIVKNHHAWYRASKDTEKKWNISQAIQLAVIYQESSFLRKSKPPRTHIFYIIPWKRLSSARGYGQVLNTSWTHYRHKTGHFFASRYNFSDVSHFIGWYLYNNHRQLGIRQDDAYNLYLSYHEGAGGFKHKTYLKKPWLKRVAKQVDQRAKRYQREIDTCRLSFFWRLTGI